MACPAGFWPALMLRMMQMTLLAALMIDDNILLLLRDVFTLVLLHVLTLTQPGGGGVEGQKKRFIFCSGRNIVCSV